MTSGAARFPTLNGKEKDSASLGIPGETLSVAIGQGYVTVTPLQMANMMAAVANGGKLYRPRIVDKVESVDGTTVREYGPEMIRTIELKPDTLNVCTKRSPTWSEAGGTGAGALVRWSKLPARPGRRRSSR